MYISTEFLTERVLSCEGNRHWPDKLRAIINNSFVMACSFNELLTRT
jgi:hypothetical protein